jgi:hypothetical protein
MKTDPATPLPECNEGAEAFHRFDTTMSKLLSVSHEETYEARSRVPEAVPCESESTRPEAQGQAPRFLGPRGSRTFERLFARFFCPLRWFCRSVPCK